MINGWSVSTVYLGSALNELLKRRGKSGEIFIIQQHPEPLALWTPDQ